MHKLNDLKMRPKTLYVQARHISQYSKAESSTWIDGFDVRRRDMPRPSNASLQVPSERVFQSPLDFPNSLVCILEDAVSRGCTAKPEIRLLNTIHWTYSRKGLYFIQSLTIDVYLFHA